MIMKNAAIWFLLTCFISAHSFAQNKAAATLEKPASQKNNTLCFPLQRDDIYSVYAYVIDLRSSKVRNKYKSLFSKYNYEFTGYVWAGILQEIIHNSDDKEIASRVFVKGQENIVTFTITQYQTRERFPQFVCPILSDNSNFEKYIKAANRHRIKDY